MGVRTRHEIDGNLHCSKCKRWRPVDAFWRDRTALSGRKPRCITCTKAKYSKYSEVEHRYSLMPSSSLPTNPWRGARTAHGYWERIMHLVILAAEQDKCVRVNVEPGYYSHEAANQGIRGARSRRADWKRDFQLVLVHNETCMWIGIRKTGAARTKRFIKIKPQQQSAIQEPTSQSSLSTVANYGNGLADYREVGTREFNPLDKHTSMSSL